MEVFLSVSEDSWRPIRVFPRGSLQGIADTCCCCDWHWCRSLLCLAATPWCGHKPLFGNIQSLCSQPAFVNADVQRMGGAGMSSWGFLQRPWCTLCQEKAMLMPSFWKQYFIACGYLSISLFSRLPYNTVLLFFFKERQQSLQQPNKKTWVRTLMKHPEVLLFAFRNLWITGVLCAHSGYELGNSRVLALPWGEIWWKCGDSILK